MLFNSLEFLIFFPVVTILFFILPHRYRWFMLLAASCYFYMFFIPVYILILFATIIIDYIAGIMIEQAQGPRRKTFLIVSLITNIGVLAIFKYYNFFIDNLNAAGTNLPFLNIILPIGLSFHTFQAMSYTIEVYRGSHPAERHFGIYALYVMFYPQLVAGPIERPQNILHQFHEKKYFDYHNVTSGLRLMLWGLIKKVVIADRLAQISDPVFTNPHDYPGITIAIASIFFAFQIFCDFSGYSDIAIGAARVMGFKLMTNFNKPYHARSISEFWKRWHISLSTWFKDYLYIPLGGNRVALPRVYFNLFFVFLISGFWHGANWTFIVWGALHGLYLVLAMITAKWRKRFEFKNIYVDNFFNVCIVFVLVTLAWIFFRANSVQDALYMITKLQHIPQEAMQAFESRSLEALNLPQGKVYVALGFLLIGFLELAHIVEVRYDFPNWLSARPFYYRWAFYYSGIFLLFFLGVFERQSFIYFQF